MVLLVQLDEMLAVPPLAPQAHTTSCHPSIGLTKQVVTHTPHECTRGQVALETSAAT